MRQDYKNKIYAAWLGKVIGVRHGANTEGASYEELLEKFGEITYYPYAFPKNFCSDDDLNGPIFFMRALEDYGFDPDITPEQMSRIIFNYLQEYKGFFWWGGYGKSTEHTAYENLKNGIPAPISGSIALNGETIAEQIGGQIFSDCWGLVFPGDPEKAADYSMRMASVTHDGNALWGARFVAGAISAAFICDNINDVIETALALIPSDSTYYRVVRAMGGFYARHPKDWRGCYHYLKAHYGYDKYGGGCHVIPNAGVIALALYYGEGDFSKTINIANMCGWDTDCNVGNAAAILGALVGIEGIEERWRLPVRDFVCTSCAVGSLNIWDLVNLTEYTAYLSDRMAGIPAEYQPVHRMDFEFDGAVQAFRTEEDTVSLANTTAVAAAGDHALEVTLLAPEAGKGNRVYYQTDYNNTDFSDSRYNPSFSPILYGGQTVTCQVRAAEGEQVVAQLYAKARSGAEWVSEAWAVPTDGWKALSFTLPTLTDEILYQCGVVFTPVTCGEKEVVCYLDEFGFGGIPSYHITMQREFVQYWQWGHNPISQLVVFRGNWKLENGMLHMNTDRAGAAITTGDYAFTDYTATVRLHPVFGFEDSGFGVSVRDGGNRKGYLAILYPDRAEIRKKTLDGEVLLAQTPFTLTLGETYTLAVGCHGDSITLAVNGQPCLEAKDAAYKNGCIGFENRGGGHMDVYSYAVSE